MLSDDFGAGAGAAGLGAGGSGAFAAGDDGTVAFADGALGCGLGSVAASSLKGLAVAGAAAF